MKGLINGAGLNVCDLCSSCDHSAVTGTPCFYSFFYSFHLVTRRCSVRLQFGWPSCFTLEHSSLAFSKAAAEWKSVTYKEEMTKYFTQIVKLNGMAVNQAALNARFFAYIFLAFPP